MGASFMSEDCEVSTVIRSFILLVTLTYISQGLFHQCLNRRTKEAIQESMGVPGPDSGSIGGPEVHDLRIVRYHGPHRSQRI